MGNTQPGTGAPADDTAGGWGTVLLVAEDSALRDAVRDSLVAVGWKIHELSGATLPERGFAPDLRAVVVAGGENAVTDALTRMAWRVPVVVVGGARGGGVEADARGRGATAWLSVEELDRLPSLLRSAGQDGPTGPDDLEEAARSIAARLLSPLGSIERLDEYCCGLVEMLGASAALVLVSERSGELAAAGAHLPRGGVGPAAIRVSAADLMALRKGAGGIDTLVRLGFPAQSHMVWTDLESRGHFLGTQVVARHGVPFEESELAWCERLAGLAGRSLERAETVARLRRNDAIKTEFVRTVSHELRTPLNTVIGYSDLLVEEAFGPLDDEQRKILRRVGDRARGLLEVIAATLELPGVDGGRVSLETRAISVADLLAEIDSDAREWRVRDDLRYSWKVDPDLPSLTTDAGKLRVLLKNLIANATKFTDRGGITVRARARDDGVEFSVEDTGIGIEGEAVHFVFDAFRQASASNAGQYGGVGLGLYIVRRLVGMLGGRLRVESEVGVGSKFFVWIPADAA